MDILAIAVHPDDETLGCGGTLLRLADSGARLHWLLLTSAYQPEYTAEEIAQQDRQVAAVKAAYPFASLLWLKLPSTRLEMVPVNQLVIAIRQVVEQIRPEVVFVPNRSDAHSDHRAAHEAISAVCKPFYLSSLGIRRVLACEILSETDAMAPLPENAFLPNVFVDVGKTLPRKLEIMRLYESELQTEPLPRSLSSISALARHRGATVGIEHAEAFMLLRELV
jgi:LmbE family N-acetylglucosaminyl deacetylase